MLLLVVEYALLEFLDDFLLHRAEFVKELGGNVWLKERAMTDLTLEDEQAVVTLLTFGRYCIFLGHAVLLLCGCGCGGVKQLVESEAEETAHCVEVGTGSVVTLTRGSVKVANGFEDLPAVGDFESRYHRRVSVRDLAVFID